MCAVTAACYIDHNSVKIEDVVKIISERYRRRFIDDGFEKDIVTAAYNVVQIMETLCPETKVSLALVQILYCIENYHTNGKKIVLKGALFNKQQKTPLPNRVSDCRADVINFHLGTIAGTFPMAPEGWTL